MAKPKEPEYKKIHRVADRKAPLFSAIFFDVFGEFAKGIKREDIEILIDQGAFDTILDVLPWRELRSNFNEKLSDAARKTLKDAFDASAAQITKEVEDLLGLEVDLSFDSSNIRVRRKLESEIGTLITEMTTDSQETIRKLVFDAQLNEVNASKLIRDIKQNAPLRSDQLVTLNNYENGIRNAGILKKSEITKAVDAMRDKLLGQRATLIARTETIRAANFGFEEGYQQAADQGLISRSGTYVEWITTPDDLLCPTCKNMDKKRRTLDGVWLVVYLKKTKKDGTVPTGKTRIVKIPNETHPNCRCAMKMHITKA